MGRSACTESQCLYKGALYLISLFPLTQPKPMIISLLDDSTHGEDDDGGDNYDSPIPPVQRDFSG